MSYEILQAARELRLTSGRAAKGVAATSCYVASKLISDYRTQRGVAEVAGVIEVTIRNRYNELIKKVWIVVSLQYC